MTVCLPFSKMEFLTVNPRTGYILFGFIMIIIIYCYQDFYYLNDIDPVPQVHFCGQHLFRQCATAEKFFIGQMHCYEA